MQARGAPRLERVDRTELRRAIRGKGRQDLDLGSDGDDHRLVLGAQLAEERSGPRRGAHDLRPSRVFPNVMLKLRSITTATDSGKSPSANAEIALRTAVLEHREVLAATAR